MLSLKDDSTKLQLINLVRQDGLSVSGAAGVLGIPRNTAIDFMNRTSWGKWWEMYDTYGVAYNPEDVAFSKRDIKIGFQKPIKLQHIPRQYIEAEVGTPDSKVYQIYKQTMKSLDVPRERERNKRILLISDMHIPYHHPDSIAFLQYLKDKYNPTRVICLGDELDKHALSFHDSDPDLPSSGDELRASIPVIKQLYEMFPEMDILESNHGSLLYRKANHHGIPRQYLKSYNEVLGVSDSWKWWYDMTLELPNGTKCYLHHGKSSNVLKTSQTMSMSSAAGHFHETFKIEYWANPINLYWAMQCGCLIDDKSYAFNYNNVNLKRPIIGTGLIVDSMPILEPMVLDDNGRWTKTNP